MSIFSYFSSFFVSRSEKEENKQENNNFEDKESNNEEIEEIEYEEDDSEDDEIKEIKEKTKKFREEIEDENMSDEELTEEQIEEYKKVIKERIKRAQIIKEQIHEFNRTRKMKKNGLRRLLSLLESELHFIKRIDSQIIPISPARIKSTNLAHIQAVLYVLYHPNFLGLCSTRVPISAKNQNKKKLIVDVVCCSNSVWISIVARNAKHLIWNSESYGSRSGIKRRVTELIQFGLLESRRPSIIICLPSDIDPFIISKLQNKFNAKQIWSEVDYLQPENEYQGLFYSLGYPDDHSEDLHLHVLNEKFEVERGEKKGSEYLNLDTSTLVALSSDICNNLIDVDFVTQHEEEIIRNFGNGGFKFLYCQTRNEKIDPVFPVVRESMRDRKIVVTRKAKEHFENIIFLIGTPSEKEKAKEIIQSIQIIEEMEEFKNIEISERINKLPTSKTINELQKEVFGKADSIPNMITCTSNSGFVRALQSNGIFLNVTLHSSRALLTNKYVSLFHANKNENIQHAS